MPFVHLPIQSGSNSVLKLMNRKHTVEQYINTFDKLNKINKEIKFSSDFIISYPGETEQDFKDTIHLINKIKFINSFSFIFSPELGTKASEYKKIDPEVSKERLKIIQELLAKYQNETNKSINGTNIEVLIENKIPEQNKLFGRNKYFNSVIADGDEKHIGKLVKVNINNFNRNTLFGKITNLNNKAA